MGSSQIQRLAGMRDFAGGAYETRREATERLGAYLGDNGYDLIDTPLLEDTELFVRKSGGELASRLYSFVDPGEQGVTLRPEFTSSVIRHFIQEQSVALPVRRRYRGPVFRYEHERGDGYRQFTQVGAELIGAGGVDADAEVLALASLGLEEAGLPSHQVRVGHLGVIRDLLTGLGLSEATILFIISHIQPLNDRRADVASLMQQARNVGLLTAGLGSFADEDLNEIGRGASQGLIQGVLARAMSSDTGRRTTDEIVGRLLKKVSEVDDPDKVEGALTLAAELGRVKGIPSSALEEARAIVDAHGLSASPLDYLETLFEGLAARGVGESRVILDLGLARGIAYYSGVIFELAGSGLSEGYSFGGGGRYDGLVRALGGADVPALGFAYTLEQVVEALEQGPEGTAPTSDKSSSPGQ